jgi:putative ABC transport system permease protein
MNELLRDIRYGLRLFWKSAGFTSVSLLALALGIGATTAIFSLLYSVLLAPLPYVDGDRIMMVWSHQKGNRNGTSPSDYLDWQKQSKSFESLNAWVGTGFTISTPDWTEQVQASRVAPGFFDDLFGQNVTLGRHFVAEDAQPGNDHVVILNNRFWKERFGSDVNIVGKKLRMSGELYTVLGVAAPSASDNGDSKMNVPLAFKPDENIRENRSLLVMGRLRPGVTQEVANAEMGVIAQRLAQSYPKTNSDVTVTVEEQLSSARNPGWALADDGRGWLCLAHRVRQHRESAARLGHRPSEGNRGAGGAGGDALADFPPVPHREPVVGRYGRCAGRFARGRTPARFDELAAAK